MYSFFNDLCPTLCIVQFNGNKLDLYTLFHAVLLNFIQKFKNSFLLAIDNPVRF